MPMLHTCGIPGCDSRTLSAYCLEHAVAVRVKKLAEQMDAAEARDEPLSAEFAEVTRSDLSTT